MNFTEIPFTEPNAARIYRNYMNRIQLSTKKLDRNTQQEIVMEINSHIYEAFHKDEIVPARETEKLLDILKNLGQPELFLKPFIADKAMDEATRTFNPLKVIRALLLNLTNGISYILFFISYLLLFCFVLLIVLKFIFPDQVGIFYNYANFFAIGIVDSQYQKHKIADEFFVPIMLILTAMMYFIITFLLKIKRSINNRVKPSAFSVIK